MPGQFFEDLRRPPPKARGYVPLVTPRPGRPIKGICLQPDLTGLMVHWLKTHSAPCLADKSACPGCQAQTPKRWKGYMPILALPSQRISILEITEEGARNCSALWLTFKPLFGRIITATRNGLTANCRQTMTIEDQPTRVDLPASPDLREVLGKIWNQTT